MLVYLDTCAIQRPLDDLTQLRVRVEAEAIIAVVTAAEAGELDLVASAVLRFETENNPIAHRSDFARRVLGLATVNTETTPAIATLAADYERAGIKPLDAAHLASAVAAGSDAFCTTDDNLIRRGRLVDTGSMRVVSPLGLIAALDP